jgi:predicted metal-dependent peptidase
LPSGNPIVYDPRFDGMSAFRVYRMLLKEKKDFLKQFEANAESPSEVPFPTNPNVDDFIKDTGNLGGIIPTTNEKGEIANDEDLDQAEKDFEMVVMNSARVLMKALGSDVGDIPGFVKEIIESHTQPQRTYKDDILDIMEEITRDDYSWAYPNKKYDIYLPSLHDLVLAELVVIVDSSGSVSQTELEVYAAEISGILTEFQGLQIHVIFHHVQAYHIETYTSDDFPISFGHIISGGTDYKHAYKRIEEEGYEPKVILHFTDLNVNKSSYPEKEPEFPVFWMNTSPRKSDGSLRHSRPPWGTVIDLDPYI